MSYLTRKRKQLPKDDPDYTSDDSEYMDDKPAQSIDFSRIWITVKQRPHDFTSWCTLLQLAEQENKLGLIRKAFFEFFKHYPYCYAYWKKFADLERRHGHNYHAKTVIKQGLEVNPMSIDLWIYFLELCTSRYVAEHSHTESKKRREMDKQEKLKRKKADNSEDEEENLEDEPNVEDVYDNKTEDKKSFFDDGHAIGSLSPERVEKLRKHYWKAVRTAGRQFKAGRLWQKFVYFERQNGHVDKVLPIFNEILRIPMDDYNQQFVDMQEFVKDSVDPCELIDDDELLDICKEELEDTNANLGIGDKGDKAFRLAKSGELSEDALDHIRNAIVQKRRDLFKENEKTVSQIWSFEDKIRRPYFHVKPLDKAQLKNWVEYLDYEIDRSSSDSIVKILFERCMTSCALYEDMWLKYANWAEYKSKDFELARSVYKRCCTIHLPKRANCRLEWATFEERQGKLEESRKILEDLNDRVPGLLAVSARLFHLKRRAGKFSKDQLIGSLKTEWANAIEFSSRDGAEKEQFWACELAWYLCKDDRVADARMILEKAIERSPSSARLYRVRGDIESYNKKLFGWCDRLCEVYERAAKSENLELWEKVTFSGHLYGILERESENLSKISEAYDLHRALRKDLARETIRAEKQVEVEKDMESTDPSTGYTMRKVHMETQFMQKPTNKGPTIMTNIPSQRTADYSEVSGDYHTFNSGGAYGNSYTWTYNKKG